jgi:predicted acylesterase/phospholipase RssA
MVGETARTRPDLFCDIVMKGGITSGVVYPHAVCELAGTYRLKNVGGTSAGAIAAAAAAAAEYGREGGAYERLSELPAWLGTDGNLAALFQPAKSTSPLFKLLISSVERKGRKPLFLVGAVLRRFPLFALLGALPGIALGVLAWLASANDLAVAIPVTVAAVVLALIGALAAALYRLADAARRAIPANAYGICSGMRGNTDEPRPALTPWLEQLIDGLAGREVGAETAPLTFADLWAGPDAESGQADPDDPWMRLEMVTTNVTNHRAERLPWASSQFFFDPVELRRLFPERIVMWLEDHPRPLPTRPSECREEQLLRGQLWPLRPLPHAADLPVVVATRMSLSFPVLLSAIPLWRVDWTRRANSEARKQWRRWIRANPETWAEVADHPARISPSAPGLAEAERCWFSDGGIASNFPVHFFDGFVPRHPTFAINLRPFHPDRTPSDAQCENVWMVDKHREGISDWWYRVDADLGQFLSNIVRTMQNRVDEAQMRLPGYRDRVVHVSLTGAEGGMNLTMEQEVIEHLTERGRCAGERLVERFAGEPEDPNALSWRDHRWVRYRSSIAALATMLSQFSRGYNHEIVPTYSELLKRGDADPPNSYRMTGPQQQLATMLSDGIVALADALEAAQASLEAGAPSPPVAARIAPLDPPVRSKAH